MLTNVSNKAIMRKIINSHIILASKNSVIIVLGLIVLGPVFGASPVRLHPQSVADAFDLHDPAHLCVCVFVHANKSIITVDTLYCRCSCERKLNYNTGFSKYQ